MFARVRPLSHCDCRVAAPLAMKGLPRACPVTGALPLNIQDQGRTLGKRRRFAWAFRNACSHDGKIHFTGQGSTPVMWRNLKYDLKDNGLSILFDDLTGVELILLMEEMDAELRRL